MSRSVSGLAESKSSYDLEDFKSGRLMSSWSQRCDFGAVGGEKLRIYRGEFWHIKSRTGPKNILALIFYSRLLAT